MAYAIRPSEYRQIVEALRVLGRSGVLLCPGTGHRKPCHSALMPAAKKAALQPARCDKVAAANEAPDADAAAWPAVARDIIFASTRSARASSHVVPAHHAGHARVASADQKPSRTSQTSIACHGERALKFVQNGKDPRRCVPTPWSTPRHLGHPNPAANAARSVGRQRHALRTASYVLGASAPVPERGRRPRCRTLASAPFSTWRNSRQARQRSFGCSVATPSSPSTQRELAFVRRYQTEPASTRTPPPCTAGRTPSALRAGGLSLAPPPTGRPEMVTPCL